MQQFFIVRSGGVLLKKKIKLEDSNFIPVGRIEYERRVKQRVEAHCLGRVEKFKYFGLMEALSNVAPTQMPC